MLRVEAAERVVRAAKLERPRALDILALEEQPRAAGLVRLSGGKNRRAYGNARKRLRGRSDIRMGDFAQAQPRIRWMLLMLRPRAIGNLFDRLAK